MDLKPLETQCEWTADALTDESIWTEVLTDVELEEADSALRHAMATSKDILDIGKNDFPLETLGQRLGRIEDELINGTRLCPNSRARSRSVRPVGNGNALLGHRDASWDALGPK